MADLPSNKKMMKALYDCWTPEYGDLQLNVNHTLTEPTCPTATFEAEGGRGMRGLIFFRADQDSISGAIRTCLSAAYAAIVLRETAPETCPFTLGGESHLSLLLAAIDKRRAEREAKKAAKKARPHIEG